MKHPVIKLFLGRLRAIAAADRAAYPRAPLPAMLGPFSPYLLRIEQSGEGKYVIVSAGEAVEALFGRAIKGSPITDLFEPADQARVRYMIAAAMNDRIGCVFGGEARLSRFRSIAIEAMLTPEPGEPGAPPRASACLIRFGSQRGRGRNLSPTRLRMVSERFVDLDGWPISRQNLEWFASRGRSGARWRRF